MLLLAGDDLPQISQNSQKLLLGNILPQIAQIYTDGLGAKDPPTDFTEFTEPAVGDDLPQISQICTDAANFRGCTCLRSALPLARARSAPTKQTKVLPQIAQNCTDGLGAKDPPTDCTEFTEPSAGDDLPQISL